MASRCAAGSFQRASASCSKSSCRIARRLGEDSSAASLPSSCADDACNSTKQLTSSWQLTDESLFASDTWSAHSYVEGSGDLDQCNGRVDDDGQYRYYTTTSFPYYLGCYRGDLLDDSGAGGPGGGMGPPPGA